MSKNDDNAILIVDGKIEKDHEVQGLQDKVESEFDPMMIHFKKPYSFEGLEYTCLDLNGLDSLTGRDLAEADKMFTTQGNVALMNEMTSAYAFIIASKASGRPLEFVENLPAKEAMKVKALVTDFLYN